VASDFIPPQDFKKKVDLFVKSGRNKSIGTLQELYEAIPGREPDTIRRQVGGKLVLTETVFRSITRLADLNAADWYESVDAFGRRLGLSADVTSQITGTVTKGIDFLSRNTDPRNLDSIYRLVGGYWESFYYSVSTFGEQRISHDLAIIEPPDKQGLMPCRVIDGTFAYVGHCFPIHGSFLYMILEKELVGDEIIVYMVNRPERPENVKLDGVIMCTSGGVQDKYPVPCAAKVAFRRLASTQEELLAKHPEIKQKPGEPFERAIRRAIFDPYIEAESITPTHRLWEVKSVIDNTIKPDQVPFAMRMERARSMGAHQSALPPSRSGPDGTLSPLKTRRARKKT
jgi:hypothetical protein